METIAHRLARAGRTADQSIQNCHSYPVGGHTQKGNDSMIRITHGDTKGNDSMIIIAHGNTTAGHISDQSTHSHISSHSAISLAKARQAKASHCGNVSPTFSQYSNICPTWISQLQRFQCVLHSLSSLPIFQEHGSAYETKLSEPAPSCYIGLERLLEGLTSKDHNSLVTASPFCNLPLQRSRDRRHPI